MSRLFRTLWSLLASRALPPLILGFFLITYIGIAFFTDETLTTLMSLTRKIPLLAAVLALLPLNCVCRMVREAAECWTRYRSVACSAVEIRPGLYDETVNLTTSADFETVERRFAAEGYKIRRSTGQLAAWRGIPLFPVRILYLAGVCCLFSGILISLVSRSVTRNAVVEGAPIPSPSGSSGIVEKIYYGRADGLVLEKDLAIQIADTGPGGETRSFGVYPPGRFKGAFVYPRYLGVAVKLLFSAPDLPGTVEKIDVLPLYPPGRESTTEISNSQYRITLSLAKPDDGSDPYMTGSMTFLFKLMRGKDLLLSGRLPEAGTFARDGCRLEIADYRRMVMTDYVTDSGVYLIFAAAVLLLLAATIGLPVRLFIPFREMLFRSDAGVVHAFLRAEGKRRMHAGIFHEGLDLLELAQHNGKSR